MAVNAVRYEGLAALVLHVRDYRESSALVQFLTREEGRLAGVYKGMRRRGRSTLVQPLCLGNLTCSGGTGLVNVVRFDETGRFILQGDYLSGGFYVLELISRSLSERHGEAALFDATVDTLSELQLRQPMAATLRRFEHQLLASVGLSLDYTYDFASDAPVQSQLEYEWVAQQGFRPARDSATLRVPGEILLALARGEFAGAQSARFARLLHQQALAPLLGPKPLISRQMLLAGSTGKSDGS